MNVNQGQYQSENSIKFDRRGLFRLVGISGLTAASAVAIAACGESESDDIGNIGVGETTPKLPPPVLNNGVYLRTLAGIEQSIAAAYQRMIDGDLLSVIGPTFPDIGDLTPLITQFGEHHTAAAATLNDLAVDQGAEPWECGNTRLDQAFIGVVFDRVQNGVAATDVAKAIPPSDDPTRDLLYLVYTLEALSAASCQAAVPQLSERALRAAATTIGVASARQEALMALLLNPGGYVSVADAENARPSETTTTTLAPTPTQNIAEPGQGGEGGGDPEPAEPQLTEIPLPVAIPSQFGSLAPITYIGGAGDENGVRLKLNFETPSLNSLAYPFESCAVD